MDTIAPTYEDSAINTEERFLEAQYDTSTYRNCAGFVSYMLQMNNQEALVSPQKLANDLDEVGRVEFQDNLEESLSEEKYLELANNSEAVAILVENKPVEPPKNLEDIVNNTRKGWIYVHFVFIDPDNSRKIYERPDLEKKAIHTDWKQIFDGTDEFKDTKKYLVFFRKP